MALTDSRSSRKRPPSRLRNRPQNEPEVLHVEDLKPVPARLLDAVPTEPQEVVHIDAETSRVWRQQAVKQRRAEHKFLIVQAYARLLLSVLSALVGLLCGLLFVIYCGYTLLTPHDPNARAEALKYVAAFAAGAFSMAQGSRLKDIARSDSDK